VQGEVEYEGERCQAYAVFMRWPYTSALSVEDGGKEGDQGIIRRKSFKAEFGHLDVLDPEKKKFIGIEEQNCRLESKFGEMRFD